MAKRALVLAGGGSRGSYQVGVWLALREMEWDFQIVTGTSVGALNGALAVQGDYGAAVELWENIATSDVLSVELAAKEDGVWEAGEKLRRFLHEMAKNGGADPRPLEDILRRCIDERKIRESPVDFAFVTVEYPGLTPRVISKDSLPEGELVDYLMASAACFPAMKMRQIGAGKFIDGGYYDNMPVSLAVERGATEVVAVDLEAIGRTRRVAAKGVKIRRIRSSWDLGVFLVFDKETAKRNIRLGYLDAFKEFGRLEGGAYTFFPGEMRENASRLGRYFDLIGVKTGLTVQRCVHTPTGPEANARLARVSSGSHTLTPSDAAVTAAAETAARLFGCSPTEVWRFEQLNGLLRSSCEETRPMEEAEHIAALLDQKAPPGELLEAVRRLDRRHATVICMDMMRRCYDRAEAPAFLKAVGRLIPDELAAGLYLFVLELSARLSPEGEAGSAEGA